jgi:4-hydroxy-tetrahydrodipicolinate reductase
MRIAIVGYGKMGKEIEAVARERNITVEKILDSKNNPDGAGLTKESLRDVDVCLEFTSPLSVLSNIQSIAEAGKNVVVGTTGWYDKLSEVTRLIKKSKTALLYAPNFSLGVNLFYQIVHTAARIFDRFDMYDVAISETHHREKGDSPSGTALALGNIVIQSMHRKKEILHETAHSKIKPEQLHIVSTRVGSVFGQHTVVLDSDADSIELTHRAKNRRGFALGALIAAEWLRGKRGVFTMKDVITSL